MYNSSGSNSDVDSDDEVLPRTQNINYNKAEAEIIAFENYKMKKYLPTIIKSRSKVLVGEKKNMYVGPPGEPGKDFPSKKNIIDYICK